ncbi:MAG: hypothetical protein BWY77_01068 [bacterium ADurb.Bin431]|nr:MAG: hypothetical protein BWY77_01068 [bacterium ADurb.Bin431]
MDAIEFLAVFVGEPGDHWAEEIFFDPGPDGRGQLVMDAIIGHGGIGEPEGFVEHLVEELARGLVFSLGVTSQVGIEVGIFEQHVPDEAGRPFVAGDGEINPRLLHLAIILLVAFVFIAAALAGGRNLDGPVQGGLHPRFHGFKRADEEGIFAHIFPDRRRLPDGDDEAGMLSCGENDTANEQGCDDDVSGKAHVFPLRTVSSSELDGCFRAYRARR